MDTDKTIQEQSLREKALNWWDSLSGEDAVRMALIYFRGVSFYDVTEEQIYEMYDKEAAIQKANQ